MAFNVNAARAQRREARGGDEFEFEIDGEKFTIPFEVQRKTVNKLRDLDQADVDGTLRVMLGTEQFERLAKHDLSLQDFQAISEEFNKESGVTPGESSASTSS